MEPERAKSTRSTWVWVVLAGVLGVAVGAIAAIAFWPDSSDESVALVPATDGGAFAFMESVQKGDQPTIAPPAAQAATAVRTNLPRDDASSVLVAYGTAPGLYGGTGDAQVCDAAKLVAFLKENPDKAAAWSTVLDIEPDGISDYVASLTPVVLLSDTLVMNHGFEDGHATELTSVLQAGTAVMVDRQGVPRVKCNCGNPLTEPEPVSAGHWQLSGEEWDGFDPEQVALVKGGDETDEFVICHLGTGETYTQTAGSALTAGTPPPNIDGDWTISLREEFSLTEPLPPGALKAGCPTAQLEGAVLVIRGGHASIERAGSLGEMEGTVEGTPKDSPEWLAQIQQSLAGAVITLRPIGTANPGIVFAVVPSPSSSQLAGGVRLTDDSRIQLDDCGAGVVATLIGSSTSTTTSSTSSTTTSTTTASPIPTEVPPTAGGPCDEASIRAAVQSMISDPIDSLDVTRCDGKWALLGYSIEGDEMPGVLEWTGSAWEGGVCQKYRDPNDFWKSIGVPEDYWIGCIVS